MNPDATMLIGSGLLEHVNDWQDSSVNAITITRVLYVLQLY